MASTLIITLHLFLSIAAASLLIFVGRYQSNRPPTSPALAEAIRSFVWWWYVMGWFYVLQAIYHGSRFFTEWTVVGVITMGLIETAVVMSAFGLLLDYLMFILFGHARYRPFAIGFYSAIFIMLLIAVPFSGPFEVIETSGGPNVQLDAEVVPIIGAVAIIAVISLPLFLTVVMLARLFFIADDATSRYRIGMITFSAACILAMLMLHVELPTDLTIGTGESAVIIPSGGVLIVGALPIIGGWLGYRAYHPAPWVVRRFHVIPLEFEAVAKHNRRK